MGNNSKSKITPYLYLVPCMLIFGIFLFYPFVKTIYLSLYKTNKMGQAKLYVGLGNYKELLQSASFINSLKVTLIFVLIVVIGGMLLGLIAAVLCNKACESVSGNPGVQYILCSANGYCIQFCGNDLPDHAPPGSRYCEQAYRPGYQLAERSEYCSDLRSHSYCVA